MLMFALELDRRSRAEDWRVASMAAHPGWAKSDLIDNGMGRSIGARLVGLIFPLLAQSTAAGALPTLYAATAPEAESGGYYGPQGRGERKGPPGPAAATDEARDEAAAARLWAEAERLTGVRFLTSSEPRSERWQPSVPLRSAMTGKRYLYIPSRRLMRCSTHILSAASICDQPMQLP